jgi:hypothetical protein
VKIFLDRPIRLGKWKQWNSPLLLHASSSARRPEHRRVIHLEFAAEARPDGLPWMA